MFFFSLSFILPLIDSFPFCNPLFRFNFVYFRSVKNLIFKTKWSEAFSKIFKSYFHLSVYTISAKKKTLTSIILKKLSLFQTQNMIYSVRNSLTNFSFLFSKCRPSLKLQSVFYTVETRKLRNRKRLLNSSYDSK